MGQGITDHDRIAEVLRAEIVSGQYDRAGGMPTAAQLAERFEVAQDAVRQATKRLQDDGLVDGESVVLR